MNAAEPDLGRTKRILITQPAVNQNLIMRILQKERRGRGRTALCFAAITLAGRALITA